MIYTGIFWETGSRQSVSKEVKIYLKIGFDNVSKECYNIRNFQKMIYNYLESGLKIKI